MHKIGDILELKIEKIVFGGEGLAYDNKLAVFVPMSAIGDIVKAKVISTKKTYSRAIITSIIKASKDRVKSDKISFSDYSGCDFAHIKYDKQLEYKNMALKDLFNNISKINITDMYDGIIAATNITNYRNKVAMPFFKEDNKIKTGFYEKKSHNIFSVEEDYLISKIAKKTNDKLLEKLNKNKFTVYNEKTNEGFLKHLIIRNNQKGEVLLAVVINKKSRIKNLIKVLEEIYNENEYVKSVYISVKNKNNNVIIGDENICLFGKEYIEEEIFDIKFKIYLDTFFQINIEQVLKLYNKAISYIKEKTENVIDAYSGTGTIAMIISKNAKKVFAVEEVKNSVISAKLTAKENKISNIEFYCNKVENIIDRLVKEKVDTIIFDPPRKGLDKSIIDVIANKNIKNIVYISCEPSTFARDINIFKEKSYKLSKLAAVDMFPNTHHIEIVSLIERDENVL